MKYKRMTIAAAAAVLLLAVAGICWYQQKQNTIYLDFGMFVGSNWDVADADSYVLMDKAIERFEDSHPNVKVRYESGIRKEDYGEWLAQKTLTGDTPDVFMVLSDDFYQYASLNMLTNLDNLIAADDSFDKGAYYETALSTGTYQDGQYALPYEVVPTLMFVNKTLLKKEGFDVPASNWNIENLYEIAAAVTKDTDGDGLLDRFGTYNYGWKEVAYSNGARLFNEDGAKAYFTDEKVIESIKYVNRLNELNRGQVVTQDDFDGGNVAFMPLLFSDYRTYKTYPYKIKKYDTFQWDCITLPAGPDGSNISEVNTLLMSINSHSKHTQLAWEFLKSLTSDYESQLDIFRYSQGASVLKGVTNSQEAEDIVSRDMDDREKVINRQLLSDVIEKGMVTPKFSKYSEVMSIAESEIVEIYDQNKDIDTELKILQRNVNHFLRQ